jgi:hypothetical protein
MSDRWTDEELRVAAEAYALILAKQEADIRVNKSDIYKNLLDGPLRRRSRKSIEYRLMNISAVIEEFGLPQILGLSALDHVGTHVRNRLRQIVLGALTSAPDRLAFGKGKDDVTRVKVDQRLAAVCSRIGQDAFSAATRRNYGSQCCFPSCGVNESELLVGAHIARWSDAPAIRGELGNGICLCALHDKAFEVGLFTVTATGDVFAKTPKAIASTWAMANLSRFHGLRIRQGVVPPSLRSLESHWARIGVARPACR